MGLRRPRLTAKLANKWKISLVVLVIAVILITIFFQSHFNDRRPKTLLIYNNKYLCSDGPLANRNSQSTQISVVIIISSCQNNFVQRSLIRRTYGAIRNINNVKILALVFMLGVVPTDNEAKTDLEAENNQFGDIIMGDFLDSYRNLSLKSIMSYDWLTSFCQEADLVLKTDDDVVVDIFKLTAELGSWTTDALNSYNFWCAVHGPETINKDVNSIYYVSHEEYAGDKLPQHCAGVGYVAPMRVIQMIADEISKSFLGPICSHEDVFMTGIVPEKINSVRSKSIEYINKMFEWVFYIDENNPNKDCKYIYEVISETTNKTDDFEEFRKRSGTRIFYLLQHGADFERKFMRLWYFVKNSYRNEKL